MLNYEKKRKKLLNNISMSISLCFNAMMENEMEN